MEISKCLKRHEIVILSGRNWVKHLRKTGNKVLVLVKSLGGLLWTMGDLGVKKVEYCWYLWLRRTKSSENVFEQPVFCYDNGFEGQRKPVSFHGLHRSYGEKQVHVITFLSKLQGL